MRTQDEVDVSVTQIKSERKFTIFSLGSSMTAPVEASTQLPGMDVCKKQVHSIGAVTIFCDCMIATTP